MPGPAFLTGDRVALRTIEEEDIEFLQEGVNDARIWRPTGGFVPYNYDQEQEFYETVVSDSDSVHLLISVDETSIGIIGLNEIDQTAGVAEIGYWIMPDYWSEGFGTEATELVVQYAFDHLRLHKVTARAFEFNEASQRLLETVGFAEEGVQREQEFIDGDYQDSHWYGLLAREWRNQ